ncbi:MAG: hypothetical protein BWK76_16215 [Desulfobulbaceae bacterium A2]|nr:MAG: hypothetical protein BWK76_16215 [Desulfobulbaceae bacterium A2]
MLAALIIAFPGIDLAVSGVFFRNGEFFLRQHPLVMAVYQFAPWLSVPLAAAALIIHLVLWTTRRMTCCSWSRRVYFFLALTMAVGPGLVVNGVFKDHFGRARPAEIQEFCGDKTFTPALLPADQCRKNCSFSCGHATLGFYFVALSLVLPGRSGIAAFWLAWAAGWLIGLARIAQGRHYVSDVLFSFIFVSMTARILHGIMFAREKRFAAVVPEVPAQALRFPGVSAE